jgi:hypothetical protein
MTLVLAYAINGSDIDPHNKGPVQVIHDASSSGEASLILILVASYALG